MLRPPILQGPPGSHPSRPCQGQNNPTPWQWQHFLTPMPGPPPYTQELATASLKSVQGLSSPPACTEVCLHPPHTWAATTTPGSLLTAVPEKPRCCARPTLPTPVPRVSPSPRRYKGLMELTPAMGARGSRTSARGPVGPVTARPGHCPAGRTPRPAPRPGSPLPPALRRARRAATTAATATSILGSPRPRFTNAASAGRRRRREGRLRPPGDAASFT